ncbi:hypothetical protein HZA86_05425 [Candidatus Uhrbacteria bacterium]|nr:hypothetical protein [Candidatus Uhrbacteria bacterium]
MKIACVGFKAEFVVRLRDHGLNEEFQDPGIVYDYVDDSTTAAHRGTLEGADLVLATSGSAISLIADAKRHRVADRLVVITKDTADPNAQFVVETTGGTTFVWTDKVTHPRDLAKHARIHLEKIRRNG